MYGGGGGDHNGVGLLQRGPSAVFWRTHARCPWALRIHLLAGMRCLCNALGATQGCALGESGACRSCVGRSMGMALGSSTLHGIGRWAAKPSSGFIGTELPCLSIRPCSSWLTLSGYSNRHLCRGCVPPSCLMFRSSCCWSLFVHRFTPGVLVVPVPTVQPPPMPLQPSGIVQANMFSFMTRCRSSQRSF